MAAITGRRR